MSNQFSPDGLTEQSAFDGYMIRVFSKRKSILHKLIGSLKTPTFSEGVIMMSDDHKQEVIGAINTILAEKSSTLNVTTDNISNHDLEERLIHFIAPCYGFGQIGLDGFLGAIKEKLSENHPIKTTNTQLFLPDSRSSPLVLTSDPKLNQKQKPKPKPKHYDQNIDGHL